MRIIRNILLFIGSFILGLFLIGITFDAVVFALFGDLSAQDDQVLLLVKFIVYLIFAGFLTAKMDETFQKRAAAKSAREVGVSGTSDPGDGLSSGDEAAAQAEDAVSAVAPPPPPSPPTTASADRELATRGATQPKGPRKRVPALVVVLAAIGLVALGAVIGGVWLRTDGRSPDTAIATSEPSPTTPEPQGGDGTSDGLSVNPRRLRNIADDVFAIADTVLEGQPEYWRSAAGKAELANLRHKLGTLKGAATLLTISGDMNAGERRFLQAIKRLAFDLDDFLVGVLRESLTRPVLLRFKTAYIEAQRHYWNID